MKEIAIGTLLFLLFFPLATANIYITEVMHSPTQVSDSEGEWLELYNDADATLDLSSWTVDGKAIGNKTVAAKSYFVLARELLDSTDTDTESFESYWGNNNLLWDENFLASEVSLSLKEEDTIVLTNGIDTETISYNSSLGGKDGKTLERVSFTEWKEGPLDGTPGFGNFSLEINTGNQIFLYVDILNNAPEILSINITDDASQEGIQVLPLLEGEKLIELEVVVNDSDGFADIQEVSYMFENQTKNFSLERNITAFAAIYTTNLSLSHSLLAGEYTINISVKDSENSTGKEQSFEYLGILRTELNRTSFQIALHSGESSEQSIQIYNGGNVFLDTEISAEDLSTETSSIGKDALEVFDEVWLPLANPVFLNTNIAPQKAKVLQFRLTVPETAHSGKYQGKITITSMESKDAI